MHTRYSDHFDTLVALISHLGATDKASRTPTRMAKDLGFAKEEVQNTLDFFPSFFRKSRHSSNEPATKDDHFYTLHLRYSRRKSDDENGEKSQPLGTDEINMLLNLVAHMVEQEQENSRTYKNLEQSYRNLERTNKITMYSAIAAATISAIAAVVVVILKISNGIS